MIISGPSGVGKTVMIQRLRRLLPELQIGVTYTTRPQRRGKKEDKIMRHVSHDEFERLIAEQTFLEYAQVHNEYYGTSRPEVMKRLARGSVLLNLDVQGALQIKKLWPAAQLIFIQPQSWPELKKRILRRGAINPTELKIRLADARRELRYKNRYDYIITNSEGKLDEAIVELSEITSAIIKKSNA